MKLICNKQMTTVCEIDNLGASGFMVKLNDENLENIAGKMSGLNKGGHKTFPARVTLIIQDLSEDQACIPEEKDLDEMFVALSRGIPDIDDED